MSNLTTTILYTNPANFTFDADKIEVTGAKITVDSSADYFYDDNFIAPSAVTFSNSVGSFSISVVETVSDSKTVDVTIEYRQDGKKKKVKYTGIIVPNQPTASLGSLVP